MTTPHRNSRRLASPAKIRGLTLVELMIAMVLGMVVVASASAIFISNRQTYRATENLGRVQENSRMSFEMMARDIRQAGGTPCGILRPQQIGNVLNNAGTDWWGTWAGGIVGYDGGVATPGLAFGTGVGDRIAGTDAIELKSGGSPSSSTITVVSHNPVSAQFAVNTVNHNLEDFDIVMVCDFEQANIVQLTGAQSGTNTTIVHNQGVGTPGNCAQRLVIPTNCTPPPSVKGHRYAENSAIAKLHAARWYIGRNPIGGNSLYRSILVNNGAGPVIVNQEIVQGVNNMTLQYLTTSANGPGAAYVDATAIPANVWNTVGSVRIVLNLVSDERIGTDGNRIQRNLTQTIALRNRVFL